MTEYHKPPKQVSNHWTPRLRRGKRPLFVRLRLATMGMVLRGQRNPPFPRPLRVNGTVRAAPLHVRALLAAANASDGRRMQPFRLRRKAGRCASRSEPSRPAHAAAAAAPHTYHTHDTPRPLARATRAQTISNVGEGRNFNSGRPRAVPLVLGRLPDREVHGSES